MTQSDHQDDAISLNGDGEEEGSDSNGQQNQDYGVDLTIARWFRFRINRRLALPFAREMSGKSGWAMIAIAFVIAFLGICSGLKMLWTP